MSLVGRAARNHPQQVTNPEVDDRATEPAYFATLQRRFGFTLDVAAAPHNTKCARFYSIDDDGLAQSWQGERVWCNPPYSNIEPWVRKAWLERSFDCPLIVMLLPANRTEQRWWQECVEPFRDGRHGADPTFTVEFLPGRLRFLRRGQTEIGPNERPPFGCCLLIWGQA